MKRLATILWLVVLLVGCTPIPTSTPPAETPVPSVTNTAVVPTATHLALSATPIVSRGCSRLSYNIDGQSVNDRAYLDAHLFALRPCVLLVMDNMRMAVDYKNAFPDAVIISRAYSRFEGGQCLQDDVQQQVDRFIRDVEQFTSRERIALYGCSNEPSWGGNNTLTQILDKEIAFMNYARSKNVTVCSGNFGVGNHQPDDIDTGRYDAYLRAVINGNHYLCVHEYTSAVLAFGVGQMTRECLVQGIDLVPPRNMCVQPNNWATAEQIQPRRIEIPLLAQSRYARQPFGYEMMLPYWYSSSGGFEARATVSVLPPYWHLFRLYWLMIRAENINLPAPRFIITEGLHDHLDDINRQEPRSLDILEARFGIDNPVFMMDLRGAPSHCRLWEEYYFPQWSCEESLLRQWEWWDDIAHPNILGMTTFAWNRNWQPFDMSTNQLYMDTETFHAMLVSSRGR